MFLPNGIKRGSPRARRLLTDSSKGSTVAARKAHGGSSKFSVRWLMLCLTNLNPIIIIIIITDIAPFTAKRK